MNIAEKQQAQMLKSSFLEPWDIYDHSSDSYALVHGVEGDKALIQPAYKGDTSVIYDSRGKIFFEPFTLVHPRPERDRIIQRVFPLTGKFWVRKTQSMEGIEEGDVIFVGSTSVTICDQTQDVYWKRFELIMGY